MSEFCCRTNNKKHSYNRKCYCLKDCPKAFILFQYCSTLFRFMLHEATSSALSYSYSFPSLLSHSVPATSFYPPSFSIPFLSSSPTLFSTPLTFTLPSTPLQNRLTLRIAHLPLRAKGHYNRIAPVLTTIYLYEAGWRKHPRKLRRKFGKGKNERF